MVRLKFDYRNLEIGSCALSHNAVNHCSGLLLALESIPIPVSLESEKDTREILDRAVLSSHSDAADVPWRKESSLFDQKTRALSLSLAKPKVARLLVLLKRKFLIIGQHWAESLKGCQCRGVSERFLRNCLFQKKRRISLSRRASLLLAILGQSRDR